MPFMWRVRRRKVYAPRMMRASAEAPAHFMFAELDPTLLDSPAGTVEVCQSAANGFIGRKNCLCVIEGADMSLLKTPGGEIV